MMIIATRTLTLREGKTSREVQICLHAPEESAADWICRFEIEWPEGKVERWGSGVDAVQALSSALQMIGAEIYTSHYHRTGKLEWLEAGRGYGFPVPNAIRDLLIGDDKNFL